SCRFCLALLLLSHSSSLSLRSRSLFMFSFFSFFFFFNDTATTEISTLSLHDALPIFPMLCVTIFVILVVWFLLPRVARTIRPISRSEERFSRNAETDLVCRLLLEKKKNLQRHLCRIYSCN